MGALSSTQKQCSPKILLLTSIYFQVENMMSTYDPHAVIVVYSVIDRASYHEAEKILSYLWKMAYNETKGIILVANKIDLERSRVIPKDGKYAN